MLTQAIEDYLKTIYKLQHSDAPGGRVTTSVIASRMEVAAASATNMIKKLAELNLLIYTPYQGVELTASGEKIALETIRHHRLIELYLSQALGYSWDQIDAEADRLEHAISEEFEDRIDEALGYPTVGAHGEPIPTKQGQIDHPKLPPSLRAARRPIRGHPPSQRPQSSDAALYGKFAIALGHPGRNHRQGPL